MSYLPLVIAKDSTLALLLSSAPAKTKKYPSIQYYFKALYNHFTYSFCLLVSYNVPRVQTLKYEANLLSVFSLSCSEPDSVLSKR